MAIEPRPITPTPPPPESVGQPVLEASDVSKHFGGFRAVDGVSLSIGPGQAIGLVGPNGSGKTTLINVISGVYPPTKGSIRLKGDDITSLPAYRRSRHGVNRTFQIPKPLGPLSVEENVSVAHRHRRSGKRLKVDPLEFVGLADVGHRPASSLTTGQQKRLDLARALATGPEVLLVDELGAGLSPAELGEVAALLRQLSGMGMALLVVEHLLGFLEAVVDSVLVLDAGRTVFSGSLRDAVADSGVIEIFLGK
jgi:branched-chain amino acid transport system ATP-binding protein